MFSLRYRYLFIIFLSLYTYLNTYFSDFFIYYKIKAPQGALIILFFLLIFFIWESNRLLLKFLKKDGLNFRFLFLFFGLSLPVVTCTSILIIYAVGKIWLGYNLNDLLPQGKLALFLAFRINLFLHCLHAIVFFFNRAKEKEIEAEALKRTQIQAQLQQVKSQINPHFLFNNLNVLAALIMNKSEDANTFVENFSEVYRYILKNQEKELISLQSELTFIKPYIFLLEKRFGSGIQINLNFSAPPSNQQYIIPVAVQMLIENAIKHNIASTKKPLKIDLFLKDDYLWIKNNLQPKNTTEISNKIGINNINLRYKLISGKEIIIRQDNKDFEVALPVLNIQDYEVFNS